MLFSSLSVCSQRLPACFWKSFQSLQKMIASMKHHFFCATHNFCVSNVVLFRMINPLHPNMSMNFLLYYSSYISYDSEKENCTKDQEPFKFGIISLFLISEPYVWFNGDTSVRNEIIAYPQMFRG